MGDNKVKYTTEYLKQLCKEKDLQLIGIDTKDINGKKRRCACVLCNKHLDKGIQWLPVEKIGKNKKPCQYCNHSKLKEIFKEEVAKVNPDIEILSEYKNWNTKVKCRCKICGNEWDGTVSCLLYGNGCKICGHVKRWDSRGRKTTQDIIKEVSEVSPDIEVLGKYKGSHEKILCRCKRHNTEWKIQIHTLLKGATNCEECQLEKAREKFGLNKENVYKKLYEVNPNLEVIDDYVNVKEKMNLHCKLHDYYFDIAPSSFLYKNSLCCPMCMYENDRCTKLFSEDLYKYYVEDVHGYIYKDREVIDGHNVISFLCKHHINKGIQKVNFHNIKSSKCCCRYCNGYFRTTEEFEEIVKRKLPNISIIGKYTLAGNRIECKCDICGHTWKPLAYNLMTGFGCPSCNASNSENKVGEILNKFQLKYERQKRFEDCKDINTLPFDFYLSDYNVAIEYDGEQHYMTVNWSGEMTDEQLNNAFKLVQKHDKIKTEYCKNNNIQLVRIPYWEKNNIECFLFDNLINLNILQEVS